MKALVYTDIETLTFKEENTPMPSEEEELIKDGAEAFREIHDDIAASPKLYYYLKYIDN